MDHSSNAKRACAVLGAAAHDFNNELTVIMSSVSQVLNTLGPDHPCRPDLLEIQAAAQRCVWKSSALLNFSARLNPDPVRASLDFLVDE